MVRVKQNIMGDTLILQNNEIQYFSKETGKLYRATYFPSKEQAENEFRRETNFRQKQEKMFHPQARVYYAQLIIKC